MNNNYVYARLGKDRKRHIVHRAQFEAGCAYAICGMGGTRVRVAHNGHSAAPTCSGAR